MAVVPWSSFCVERLLWLQVPESLYCSGFGRIWKTKYISQLPLLFPDSSSSSLLSPPSVFPSPTGCGGQGSDVGRAGGGRPPRPLLCRLPHLPVNSVSPSPPPPLSLLPSRGGDVCQVTVPLRAVRRRRRASAAPSLSSILHVGSSMPPLAGELVLLYSTKP